MLQLVLFSLFIITVLLGAFSYFSQEGHYVDPVKFVMEKSGLNSVNVFNRQQNEQLNIMTSQGLIRIRGLMDDLAVEQNNFLDAIKDQQLTLRNTGQKVSDIMLKAQQNGQGSRDILQLRSLASEIQDEQRLLIDKGRFLITLNDQIANSRRLFATQLNLANISTENSLGTLQHDYASFNDQAAVFLNKVSGYDQQMRDQMDKMQDQLNTLSNNTGFDSSAQQQMVKDRVQNMLDREHENMVKLADVVERSKNLLQDAREKLMDSQELLKDKLQQNRDKIEEEHQRAQDQKDINQQRVADQEQRTQDQQAAIRQHIEDQEQWIKDQQNR